MPTGPQGQQRPADTVGCAVTVGKIAVGDLPDDATPEREIFRKAGQRGGRKRAKTLSADERHEQASHAAHVRWKKD